MLTNWQSHCINFFGQHLTQVRGLNIGGDCSLPSKYHPVTLTGHITKTMEKVVKIRMVEWMEEHTLFKPTAWIQKRTIHSDKICVKLGMDVVRARNGKWCVCSLPGLQQSFWLVWQWNIPGACTWTWHNWKSWSFSPWLHVKRDASSCGGWCAIRMFYGSVLGPLLFIIFISSITEHTNHTHTYSHLQMTPELWSLFKPRLTWSLCNKILAEAGEVILQQDLVRFTNG